MEIWDAYNRQGEKLAHTLERSQTIPAGQYHIVCEIIVQHYDGDYLLMQRDWNKKTNPGKFEVSAGGSALQGETAEACARREVKEETGLEIESLSLIQKDFHFKDRCYWHTFHALVNQDKDAISLQEGETIAYRWLSPAELLAFIDSDQAIHASIQRFERYYRRLKEDIR